MLAEHQTKVRAKEAEIQQLTKNQPVVKEKVRIAYKELGEMHNKAGFLTEAMQ